MLVLGLLLALSQGARAPQAETILRAHCYRCHGANGQAERGIDVLDREGLIEFGVLEPGNPKSALVRVVESGRMPLKGRRLTRREVDVLRRWVVEMGK